MNRFPRRAGICVSCNLKNFLVLERNNKNKTPGVKVALIPFAVLFMMIGLLVNMGGTGFVQDWSWGVLLLCAFVALTVSLVFYRQPGAEYRRGLKLCSAQILPAVPILALIATVTVSWMASGVVPTLIVYGLELINPSIFPLVACVVCACVSVLSGSSWTTIATIGVAFIGIGEAMGYYPPLVAGAIISGAYFGDKVSPLSDTTVLASSSCGVDLFTHIRNMMNTSLPALGIALAVFGAVGLFATPAAAEENAQTLIAGLESMYRISAWTLLIPLLTLVILAFKVSTRNTLILSTLAGCVGVFVFQGGGSASGAIDQLLETGKALCVGTSASVDDEILQSLTSTGGIKGMLPTILLVLSGMFFGGIMLGAGMISAITGVFLKHLHSRCGIVSATVGTGVFLNCATSDQYLSIILNANVYSDLYGRKGMAPKVLSRTVEDSTSVTSVLVPWNSCGLTQSTVLGVATLAYLPFCVFNLMSPLMSIAAAWITERRNRKRMVLADE